MHGAPGLVVEVVEVRARREVKRLEHAPTLAAVLERVHGAVAQERAIDALLDHDDPERVAGARLGVEVHAALEHLDEGADERATQAHLLERVAERGDDGAAAREIDALDGHLHLRAVQRSVGAASRLVDLRDRRAVLEALKDAGRVSLDDELVLVPQAPSGEPLMVLVDPRSVPASVQALDVALPPEPAFPDGAWSDPGVRQRYDAEVEQRIDEQIALMAALVNGALGARAAALGPVERAAALRRAVDTYRAHRIRGSYWANQAGCGVYVEEVPQTGGIGCGMGHTPERAQRFLYFFSPSGNPV